MKSGCSDLNFAFSTQIPETNKQQQSRNHFIYPILAWYTQFRQLRVQLINYLSQWHTHQEAEEVTVEAFEEDEAHQEVEVETVILQFFNFNFNQS